jgi:DNA repair exonuclease SbcCD ATPase subunit
MNTILKEKVQKNKEDLVTIGFEMKSLSDKIEMHKKHLETMRTNNDDIIKGKQEQINKLNADITTTAALISDYTATNETLTETISDHDKTSKKLNQLDDLQRQVNVKLNKLQKDVRFFDLNNDCPTCRQGIQHDHKTSIINKNNEQIDEIQDGYQLLQSEIKSVQDRLGAISSVNQQLIENNKKISELNTQVSMWNSFIVAHNKEIAALSGVVEHQDDNNEELQNLKNDLKTSITTKESLSKQKQVLDVAASLLKDGGIKTKIIKQYIPVINQLINKYLSAMDFFVNFELNENFEETIKSRFRDEFTYASFSEGEKMRIDLALLFAWRAVAKLRNSSSTNLLIMDEVFDSSLDGGGTDEFIKILNGLAQDTNVFIISHKGDQLYDKFHSVVKFEKVKNFSRIAA